MRTRNVMICRILAVFAVVLAVAVSLAGTLSDRNNPSALLPEGRQGTTAILQPHGVKYLRSRRQQVKTTHNPVTAASEFRSGEQAAYAARIEIYFDAGLSQQHACTAPGDTVNAYIVLENAPSLAYGIRFAIDKGSDTTLTFIDDVKAFFMTFDGDSQTGLGVGWFGGMYAGTQLHIMTVRYLDNVGCTSCYSPSRPLSIVPDPGSQYGEVIWYDQQTFLFPEFADGGTSYTCGGVAMNVIVSQMTTPANVTVGDDISSFTTVTAKNVGVGLTPPFKVRMYYSPDDTITTSDLQLTNGESAPIILDTGDSVTVNFPGLEIPLGSPGGPGYLGAFADVNDSVPEVNESDNTLAASVFVDTSYVNLIVAGVIAPASAELEDTIDVTVVVGNTGNVTSGSFGVSVVYCKLDSTSNASYISGTATVNEVLPGDTAMVTISDIVVGILTPSGPGLIRTFVDRTKVVDELDEDDNTEYTPIAIGSAGDTVCVYFEDFADGDGGWTPVPRTGQNEIHWQVETHNDVYGLSGSRAMVCNTVDSTWIGSGYRQWEGYGHNWIQRLRKTYTLPAGPVFMNFDLIYDTEHGFDYLYARLRPVPGDTFTTLRSYTGFGVSSESISLTPWAEQTIEFEFFYQSEGAYDDSDGLHSTEDYPAGLDNIQVTGHSYENFETDDEGWTAISFPPIPGSYRLVETPQCFPGLPGCDTTATGAPYDACNVWVAYDSITGEFPYMVPGSSEFEYPQSIAIESPSISLPSDGNRYYLECDVYWDIPIGAYLFAHVEWTFDQVTWFSNYYWYPGNQGWEHWSVDISGYVLNAISNGLPLTDFMFRWGVSEAALWFDFTGPTPGPYFNNISVKVAGTASPGVACTPGCGTATGVAAFPLAVSTLAQNYPNPFNPRTTIVFSLADPGAVELKIYDVAGRLVRTLVDGYKPAAQHSVSWDGTDERGNSVSSGVYFYRLRASEFNATRKMVILK